MGKIIKHLPVKLITAFTYHPEIDIKPVLEAMENLHSTIDLRSEIYDFTKFTSFYKNEMGDKLLKCFFSFYKLFEPENLPKIKISTNELEQKYMSNENRQINLDPGYLTQAKLVLATTKNYSHRVYIGQGIFGDVHMQYGNKTYQPQTWTYPDYKNEQNVLFFNNVRKRYLEQLAEVHAKM